MQLIGERPIVRADSQIDRASIRVRSSKVGRQRWRCRRRSRHRRRRRRVPRLLGGQFLARVSATWSRCAARLYDYPAGRPTGHPAGTGGAVSVTWSVVWSHQDVDGFSPPRLRDVSCWSSYSGTLPRLSPVSFINQLSWQSSLRHSNENKGRTVNTECRTFPLEHIPPNISPPGQFPSHLGHPPAVIAGIEKNGTNDHLRPPITSLL